MHTHKIFKRTYLHIGLGKTGTSAIQEQLYQNSERLEREHDIHFPCTFGESDLFNGNHSQLLKKMFVHKGKDHSMPSAAISQASKDVTRLHSLFENSFSHSHANQLLISAEGIGHFGIPYLELLAKWLQEFSQEIEIVACVRHPIEALSSEIQQRVKFGDVLEDLYETPPYYRFSALFERIENAFPNSTINLYTFSEATKSPKGLTGVFLQKIGVDMKLPVHMSNRSMSHEAALLLSALNRARPMSIGKNHKPSRAPTDVKEFMRIPGRTFLPPPAVYEKILGPVESEVIWLKEKYGLTLEATSISSNLDYNYFSDDSIEDIALSLAKLSNIRYTASSPFRFFIGFFREMKDLFRRYI
jgi:hypothetical protein